MTIPATSLAKTWIPRAGCIGVGLLISLSAAAQQPSVVGRWSFSSPAQQGAPAYAGLYMFTADGRVQFQLAGGIACIGGYQFDGQSLATQMSACQSCVYGGYCTPGPEWVAPMSFGAPVQFQGPYTLVWLTQPQLVLHRN